ncbi:MAG TPA: peptidylprolyl isomerase [Thermomicrobiales bacterium]|nr:peptidylprolyl isomerase [Thermomicrobiales bacterium]
MRFGSLSLVRRGLTAVAAGTLFVSSIAGLGATSALAQDATASPGAAGTPAPTVVTNVDTSGCWSAAPTYTSTGASLYPQWTTAPNMVIDPNGTYTATITTNLGVVTIQLYASKAPTTVNNFVCLAGHGYYDKTVFHRILAGFVVQGGDPTGSGSGGPGYQFKDELPTDLNYTAGVVAMANAGANTNGSQFFICLDDLSSRLTKSYSIFGTVSGGMDVVNALGAVPVTTGPSGESSSPTAPAGIISVAITKA